jgi:hypothetical protein
VTDGVIRNCNAFFFCVPLQDRYHCNNPRLWGMSSKLTINQWTGGSNWRWLKSYVFSIAIKCMLFSVELHRPWGQPTGTEILFFPASCIRSLSLNGSGKWEVPPSGLKRQQRGSDYLESLCINLVNECSCYLTTLTSHVFRLINVLYVYVYVYKIHDFLLWNYELCRCLLKTDDRNNSELHFSEPLRSEQS